MVLEMKYIQNSDIRPLPDLLKKIGEDVQDVIKRKVRAHEEELAKTEAEISRVKEELGREFQSRISLLESEHKSHENDWAQKLSLLRTEKEEAVKSVTEQYEEKIKELTSRHRKTVEDFHGKIKVLQDEVQVKRDLELKVYKLEAEIPKLQEKIVQLEERNAAVQEELQVTMFNLKNAERKIDEHEKTIQELTSDRNDLKDTTRRQEKKITTLQEEKQKLMARIEKLMGDLERKDGEFREKNRQILEENASMTEQLKLLRSQQKTTGEAMEKLRLAMLDMKWKLEEWNPNRLKQEIDTLAKQVEDVRNVAKLRTEQTVLLKEKNEELQTALLYVERDLVLERQLLPMMHSLSGPVGSKGLDLRPAMAPNRSSSGASLTGKGKR